MRVNIKRVSHRIEVSSIIGAVGLFTVMALSGYNLSLLLLISMNLLAMAWIVLISGTYLASDGKAPLWRFFYALNTALLVLGIMMKISFIEGGVFVLYLGLIATLISALVLFLYLFTSAKFVGYNKQVLLRMAPAFAIGLLVYFTPYKDLIEILHSSNPEKAETLKNSIVNPYEDKVEPVSILFVSNRDGNSNIYEMNPDGEKRRALTKDTANEWSPRPMPNGESFLYLSDKNGGIALYQYNFEGELSTKLFDVNFDDFYFQIAPDGNSIVCNDTVEGHYQVFIKDLNGDNLKVISSEGANDSKPTFSPDGQSVFFQSDRDGNLDIFQYFLNNDSLVNITNHPANDGNPEISPLGDVIVFRTDRDSLSEQNLYYQILASGETGPLTSGPEYELIAAYSPDAKFLAYGSNSENNWDIYRMLNNGDVKIRLTTDPAFDGDARWLKRSLK